MCEKCAIIFFYETKCVTLLEKIAYNTSPNMKKAVLSLFVMLSAGMLQCTSQEATAQEAFQYRSLYTPQNSSAEFRAEYGTHHVDSDWDLWGHAMKKIAGKATDEVYARVDGELHREQYCFSSDELYKRTTDYILDQFGEGTADYSARICIMPQDNKVACTCPKCTRKGNATGNATPAVTDMLCRLAKRFPRHRFFTSAYNTTLQVPKRRLPANVGVWVSASRFQLRVALGQAKGYDEMRQMLEAWTKVTPNVYVWEYERNFNDYLTPFPCLHVMQSRLRFYREMGVKGIFMNGSGYDYSSFDDVQTAVLAQLMVNPELDVDHAVTKFFQKHYPVTAPILLEYYNALEKRTVETNHHLPIYSESMQEVVDSYLNAKEFTEWRARLDKASKNTQPEERTRLNYLLTALSYTQLRLFEEGCLPLDVDLRAEMVEVLRGYRELKDMKVYSEAEGSIADYLSKYEKK